ncbi:MAG: UDP-N-acetylmuramoyl-L-alanine--D-glutamate ligase [Candidatus Stygibacter australis]|nr:UDP-N-acetylmuramoyl-L-alanine--D-glutamate ligase [Candidatus Stygibacter australis]MDP8320956.1 UDP-N-acetylmuramoyl-L-alanine--D-glutamate ligase [Candidatus Stygibacter australis]
MIIKDKKFAVVGMARSGIAAARKISELGGNVFLSDNKPVDKIPNAEELSRLYDCEFGGHSEKLLAVDCIIVSPGVPLSLPILQKARDQRIELISEIEFGYRVKSSDSRIICCTGSNGKSTTVSLIYHLLAGCGFKTVLGGNIGTPFTAFPIEKPGIDFIVLELSSFQLELIDEFKADAAIILNITPDHLDRYQSFEHYAETKFNIFHNQTENDLAIINLDDPIIQKMSDKIMATKKLFSLRNKTDGWKSGKKLRIGDTEYNITDLSIAGPHNEMNCLASLLAIEKYTKGKNAKIIKALKTFHSLPHRLEFIQSVNGIRFFNDSKATNTDAVKYALLSFTENVHIILGGSDKGEDFSILIPYLKPKNIHIYLIGATRKRMEAVFKGQINFLKCENMEDAVRMAYSKAIPGDIILLSPACASYDAFKNYIHRGETFCKIVQDIADEN